VLFATGILFFRLKMYLNLSGQELINQICIALGMGYFGWELARATVLVVQKKFPGLHRMRLRLIILVLSLVVLGHIGYIMRVILHFIIDGLEWDWPTVFDYSDIMGVVIFYNTVIISLYEGGYIWKQWKTSLEDKEKALRSEWQAKYDLLKAQINPHFIFNCLNSIKGFIYDKDYKQADKYLDRFAELMRSTIDNSDASIISLKDEMHYLDNYLQLEKLRFEDKFEYRINIYISVDIEKVFVPAMLLQPYVENAIRHGMRSLENRKGQINITAKIENNVLVCAIDDNGIGREKAAALKSRMHIEYQSKGMNISKRRAELYNIEQEIIDKKDEAGNASGTTIIVKIPLDLKP